jgi:hypothetical protein
VDLSMMTNQEKTNLETHVDLCAMRYQQLDSRLTTMETKMDGLQEQITNSHRSMVTTIIGSAATILSGLLGLILVILTQ